ncbi:RNA polymerase sigma factor [Ohtaekwangia koreensis]|uniref:RNA polymerase sigma-70 factor, ECF subfamily n=1 Tax=Ohtaekwangia koreensis TaxID=688867 RepID=A0A1T5JIZ4_9BACT|nr:sigma-70 family RNA polymerase sigma factor [Ohtaekwangia koreensis]SKC51557.1 RNA polymerase sigma-70 factor, ECF subfamily [Ohtaekwangia koreensis]
MIIDPDLPFIDRILAGEQNAYAELIGRHKSYAYTIAFKILQNRPEAEEAAQDSFIKAYQNLKTFNREARFSTWLYRIVFNTSISYKRKNNKVFQSIENTVVVYTQEGEGLLEKTDKTKYLNLAMAKLNEADRTALSLFYLDEFSLDEIAAITGMQANTVKVRIHRARQRLADELKVILNHEALTL